MYSQAFGLQEATNQAVFNDEVMTLAAGLTKNYQSMSLVEFVDSLFEYSSLLSAVTAALATERLLTAEQLQSLMATIEEIETLDSEITD